MYPYHCHMLEGNLLIVRTAFAFGKFNHWVDDFTVRQVQIISMKSEVGGSFKSLLLVPSLHNIVIVINLLATGFITHPQHDLTDS